MERKKVLVPRGPPTDRRRSGVRVLVGPGGSKARVFPRSWTGVGVGFLAPGPALERQKVAENMLSLS